MGYLRNIGETYTKEEAYKTKYQKLKTMGKSIKPKKK